METYDICDRCGARILVKWRHLKGRGVFILCSKCKREVEANEDRLNVLEGFVEEVGKLANPIIKLKEGR